MKAIREAWPMDGIDMLCYTFVSQFETSRGVSFWEEKNHTTGTMITSKSGLKVGHVRHLRDVPKRMTKVLE